MTQKRFWPPVLVVFARSEPESCALVHCHGWSGVVKRIIHMTQYTSVGYSGMERDMYIIKGN